MSFGVRKITRTIGSKTFVVNEPDHPKGKDSETVIVKKQEIWGRTDYVPCNDCANSWLRAWSKKSFNTDELKFIASMGYCVLVMDGSGSKYEEFK